MANGGRNEQLERARTNLLQLITSRNNDDDVHQRADQVEQILDEYPQLCELRNSFQFLPLHQAVYARAPLQVLQALVACFPAALHDRGGNYQETPLHIASCIHGFSPQVYNLLTSQEAVRSVDTEGMLPLHRCCQHQFGQQSLDVVRGLVEAYPESVKAVDGEGGTPLFLAVGTGFGVDLRLPIIQFLAEQYPEALTRRDNKGCMPLHRACIEAAITSLPVVRFLMREYPKSAQVLNACGSTLLHVLLKYARDPDPDHVVTISALLVEHYPDSVHTRNQFGRLPLHLACENASNDHFPIMDFLVQTYRDALKIRDENDETPLHIACRAGGDENAEIIRYLVRECPAVLEEQDVHGLSTPLHDLCRTRYHSAEVFLETMELLTISRAAVTVRDDGGRTPAHCLAHAGNVTLEAWDLLVHSYPGPARSAIVECKAPLHLAVEGSVHATSSEELEKYIHTVQVLLLQSPDSIQARDDGGAKPLTLACELDADLSIVYELARFNPAETLELLSPHNG